MFWLSFNRNRDGQITSDYGSHISGFRSYATKWDRSDGPAFIRRCVCFFALGLHIVMNVMTIASHGGVVRIVLGVLFSVLNILCIAFSLWKLDVMRGTRLFYKRIYTRTHFDYLILFITLSFSLLFALLMYGRIVHKSKYIYIEATWPCIVITDIICFVGGWYATQEEEEYLLVRYRG
ncbi:hypothetical protein BGZ60DRAFT_423841 [Tricladium varicosporioides]|nr:hypothetical protein BGZ60DRAFT_423841 [Hymenoscyphus varicosporioides]